MSKRLPLSCLLLLLAAACSGQVSSNPLSLASSQRETGPMSEAMVSAPVVVKWVPKGVDGSKHRLIARVERRAPMRLPLTVQVHLPEGATLLVGKLDYELPPTDSATVDEREVVVSVTGTSKDDLLLVADIRSVDFGLHAVDAYRFGRPAPELPCPQANGPAVRVRGIDFGPSVPAAP